MASSTPLCGICDVRHVSKLAVIWCSDCDEGFCTDCSDHHHIAKASRHHSTTSIENYQKLPAYIQEIEQFCKEHDEKFSLFCKDHEAPCCRTCLKKHKQCQNISKIEDVVQNVKTSHAFQATEQNMSELSDNIKKIGQDRTEKLKSLENNKQLVKTEIKKFRDELNNHIDKLQEDIIKELEKVYETERKRIQKIADGLQTRERAIEEIKINMSNIKQHASDLQAYIAMKQIQNGVDKTDATVDSLVNSDKLQHKILSLKINSSMKDILSSVKKFGNIVVQTTGSDIVIKKKKNQQAQLLVPHQGISIDNIKLQLQQTLNFNTGNISGCCVLPDGRLVFTSFSFQGKLIILNADGTHNTTLTLPSWTYDVIYIKHNDSFAVSCNDSGGKCIKFINIKTNKLVDTINIQSSGIYGMAVKNNTLFFITEMSINSMNLTNKKISKFIDIESMYYSYIEIFENNMYQTNKDTHTVICYDFSGEVKWRFKDETIIQEPRGISVDNRGNVYVAGDGTSNVVVFSPDGLKCRELLSSKDKLSEPCAISFDRSKELLLVSNWTDNAFVFKVT